MLGKVLPSAKDKQYKFATTYMYTYGVHVRAYNKNPVKLFEYNGQITNKKQFFYTSAGIQHIEKTTK